MKKNQKFEVELVHVTTTEQHFIVITNRTLLWNALEVDEKEAKRTSLNMGIEIQKKITL